MDIGIIGAGNVGQAAATRLVTAGHRVMLSNSRGPESLASVEQALGQDATAGTVEQAAGYGPVVLVAIPLGAVDDLPVAALAGRIVIDADNYSPDRDGHIAELDDDLTTSSELLAALLPGARVVKALNTMRSQRLAHEAHPRGARERLAIPISGDDEDAKDVVSQLVDDMGFDPVDIGTLAQSARQQPGSAVYDVPLHAGELRERLKA